MEAVPHTVWEASLPGLDGSSTVMVMQSVTAQSGWPVVYTVTQYSVVAEALATGSGMDGFERPVTGLQLYTRSPPGQLATPLQTRPFAGSLPKYKVFPSLSSSSKDCSPDQNQPPS